MKRAALALLLILSLSVCACSTATVDDTPRETTAVVDGWENPIASLYREREDKVPTLDLGGKTIRIISMESDSNSGQLYDDEICVDELKSEPLNDTIYNRNLYVQDRLNCKIVNEFGSGNSYKVGDKLSIMFNSGEDTYQIIAYQAARTMNLALDGYLYDLRDIEDGYIEFDAPWWEQQYMEELAMKDKTYALAGALSLSLLRSVHATFFNKMLAESNNVEDLYKVVWDGRWTIDYQAELSAGMYRDVNGDSNYDTDDVYGFATPGYWATDSYWCAFDLDVLSRDENGEFYISINEDKLHSALTKIYDLCRENPGTYWRAEIPNATELEKVFASDRVLFMTNKLCVSESVDLRNMSSDYGILPMPKYDLDQKEYGSMPFELFQMFSIPITAEDPGKLTAVLELMCAENWRKVIPTYSDVVLKGRYMSDVESRRMFELIIDSIRVEAGLIYCYQIEEISTFLMRYSIDWDDLDKFSSMYASKLKRAQMRIKFLNDRMS